MKRIIKSVEFNNYKAFKSGKINLSPISILLGTNSSGKSSLIKLLLMLSQSSNIPRSKDDFLITYGELADLGDIKNIFFNQDERSAITLKFNLDSLDTAPLIRRALASASSVLEDSIRDTYQLLHDIEKPRTNHYKSIIFEASSILRKTTRTSDENYIESIVYKFEKTIKMALSAINYVNRNKDNLEEKNLELSEIEFQEKVLFDLDESTIDKGLKISNNLKNIEHAVKLFTQLSTIKTIDSLSYTISSRNKGLCVDSVRLDSSSNFIQLDLWNNKTKRSHTKITSNIIDTSSIDKSKRRIKEVISFQGFAIGLPKVRLYQNMTSPRMIREKLTEYGPLFFLAYTFGDVSQKIQREFSSRNINHVSPLRFTPERYFLMDNKQENQANISNSGKQLLEILNDKPDLKKDVNKWMKKFDLEVDVNDITHIIHSIKIKDSGLDLDITDVGFGVSQILPVILQSVMAAPRSLTIIEQPEIHIHPKMQSALADFFIEQINDTEKYFLIETHSEALLKRLRRRMAENNSDNRIGVSYENVDIHFIEKRKDKKSGAKIKTIDISPTGAFEWPKDFKENDIEDTIEFMKHQG
ncbi:AAA family ATPase [Vibrio splendidus]|uniref:AAA family ATPase n=1 Tax=Vibrio splendidus TaxID=29497 RepID=UPI00076ABA64|nr:AAA family ATPase [Vibrio splendidus]